MTFFWERSSDNLAQLFRGLSPASLVQISGQVSVLFAEDILRIIRRGGFESANKGNALRNEVINELSSLLASRADQWEQWKKSDVTKLLADLVPAAEWKLQIPAEHYSAARTADLARAGMHVLPALTGLISRFHQSAEGTIKKKLVTKHLNNDIDAYEVTERALRCVIANLRYGDRTRQLIFEWDKHYKLRLKSFVIERYLYEQMALFAFMKCDDNNALPIREIEIKLIRYVAQQVEGEEKTEIAKDIVQDAFLSFFKNKDAYRRNDFYVDRRLYSFFISIVKDKKGLQKHWRDEERTDRSVRYDEFQSEDDSDDENLNNAKDRLRNCVSRLKKECRLFFMARYFGDFSDVLSYEAVAEMLTITAKAAEHRNNPCSVALRICMTGSADGKFLRF